MNSPFEQSDELPVYVISIAAELSGMHPQTLREYERRGLVSPGRSGGGGRRYSMRDILALREIQRLSQELHAEVAQLRVELESTRAVAARLAELRRSGGEHDPGLVPVRRARVAVWEPLTGPPGATGQPRGDK